MGCVGIVACDLGPLHQPYLMKLPILLHFVVLAMTCSAWGLETWVLADGRLFEADVKQVVPGIVLFTLRTGTDQPLEINKLSDRSRKRLAEVLGLGGAAVEPVAIAPAAIEPAVPAVTPAAVPAPAMQPVAAAPAMPLTVVARDPGAVDATDVGSLEANIGLTATVIGKVKKIVTLGSSGHKLLEFEDTDFNFFVNKRQAELPGWNFDALVGKLVQGKGKIGKYNEKLQVQLYDPAQLGVVE